jgi:hypothetical protein
VEDNTFFNHSMHLALRRTGATQICLEQDGRFWMEPDILGKSTHKLVVSGLWSMLWVSHFVVDVHIEELSVQYGLSDD